MSRGLVRRFTSVACPGAAVYIIGEWSLSWSKSDVLKHEFSSQISIPLTLTKACPSKAISEAHTMCSAVSWYRGTCILKSSSYRREPDMPIRGRSHNLPRALLVLEEIVI